MMLLEFIFKGLRSILINLILIAIVGLFTIKSFGSMGVDISSMKTGVNTVKEMSSFSGNLDSVFSQAENLGK